jgi:hypothetical protein
VTAPLAGGPGFKIADGYVEVHGVTDRRSVIAAADAVTRGVSDQMTTGVAFSNLREGGRKMGAVLGEHGGPAAAREVTEGMSTWIDQGESAGHVDTAGRKLGRLLGRSSGSPFVEHLLEQIARDADTRAPGPGTGTPTGDPGRDGGRGGDDSFLPRSGGEGGRGGNGSTGRGRTGTAGPAGKDADREGRSIGDRMGQAAVGGFLDAFTGGFRGLGSLVTANPVFGTAAIAIGIGLAVAAAPAFGAAFAAALIGGAGLGVIGLGAFLLKDDPQIKAAAGKLGKTAGSVFKGAAQPLIEPFVNSMAILENLLVKIGPDLTEMFMAIAPAIVPLTRGFAGFVEGALPGFLELIKAATPFLMDLENSLPLFGEHIGKFLSIIADAGPGATAFFNDFLNLLGILLVAFGHFINVLAGMYQGTRTIILTLVDVFVFLYKGVKANIDLIINIFQAWYNAVRDVFFKARRDSDGFVGFLKALPGKVGEAIKGVPGKIKGVFADAGRWLESAGGKIIAGLIRGIKNAIPDLNGILDWVTDRIPDWKGPPERDRRLLEPTGESIMQGLGRGIERGAQGVKRDLGGLTAALPGAATAQAPTMARTHMGNVIIQITGVWDFSKGVPDELTSRLYRALDRYEKAYA